MVGSSLRRPAADTDRADRNSDVACTMEAKICPDAARRSSAQGRIVNLRIALVNLIPERTACRTIRFNLLAALSLEASDDLWGVSSNPQTNSL